MKKYRIFVFMGFISFSIYIAGCSGNGSENSNGTTNINNNGNNDDAAGTDTVFSSDDACNGPNIGQSPNDNDNTFLSLQYKELLYEKQLSSSNTTVYIMCIHTICIHNVVLFYFK